MHKYGKPFCHGGYQRRSFLRLARPSVAESLLAVAQAWPIANGVGRALEQQRSRAAFDWLGTSRVMACNCAYAEAFQSLGPAL